MTIHATFPNTASLASDDADLHALADEDLHRALAHWNHRRLAVGVPSANWREDLYDDLRMRTLEGQYIEAARAEIAERVNQAPTDVDGFIRWFEALKVDGPGQNDPLFDWLAEEPRSTTCAGSCARKRLAKRASMIWWP